MPTKRTDCAGGSSPSVRASRTNAASSVRTKRSRQSGKAAPSKRSESSGTAAPVKREPHQKASATPERGDAPAKPARAHRALRIIIISAVAVLLVLGGLFAWNRWFRFNDAADIQGEWKIADKQATMVINGQQLKLTSEVSYAYTLDTWSKTITYTFGTSTGHASYRFSEDRQTLVMEDNAGTNWLIALHVEEDAAMNGTASPAGTSRLTKLSSNGNAIPQTAVNNTTAEANAAGVALDNAAASTSGE